MYNCKLKNFVYLTYDSDLEDEETDLLNKFQNLHVDNKALCSPSYQQRVSNSLIFCRLLIFFSKSTFRKFLSGIPSEFLIIYFIYYKF